MTQEEIAQLQQEENELMTWFASLEGMSMSKLNRLIEIELKLEAESNQ